MPYVLRCTNHSGVNRVVEARVVCRVHRLGGGFSGEADDERPGSGGGNGDDAGLSDKRPCRGGQSLGEHLLAAC